MTQAADIFGRDKALVGMVHLPALPGTPGSQLDMSAIIEQATAESILLTESGFDALLIENMHDVPYLQRNVGPEIVAAMTIVACAIRRAVELPLGVQVLAGANHDALAIAHAANAEFIRVEGFVFSAVADEGLLEKADAGPLLRYRKQIGAERIKILADIKKKHSSHALTADIDVGEMAKAAEFFGADGVIITGIATGQSIRIDDLGTARIATQLPLLVGSGVTPDSVANLYAYADALIVGSWYKRDGLWSNPPCPERAKELVEAVREVRSS
ncbi:MAG: BtpA/SgcQ family protein [Planctomycetota bacterium]|nr:BtpA/SgcQ family protein [Planctomycetota bacterium]